MHKNTTTFPEEGGNVPSLPTPAEPILQTTNTYVSLVQL